MPDQLQTVLIVSHPGMLEHQPLWNKEQPLRLQAAWRGINAAAGEGVVCERLCAVAASDAELLAVHALELVQLLRSGFDQGRADAGLEAPLHQGTWTAAALAAGAGPTAVRRLAQPGAPRRAFCAVRPPGHHANASNASGYCYLNNAAITSQALLAAGLARRVAILDLDHHHGNGTQDLLGSLGSCAYASVHASGYPGSGLVDGPGPAFNRLLRRADRAGWRAAVSELIEAVRSWGPDALVLSFGTDALAGDPLGDLGLAQEDLDGAVRAVLARWPDLPLISLLEGGYDPGNLEEAVRRHLHSLGSAG